MINRIARLFAKAVFYSFFGAYESYLGVSVMRLYQVGYGESGIYVTCRAAAGEKNLHFLPPYIRAVSEMNILRLIG